MRLSAGTVVRLALLGGLASAFLLPPTLHRRVGSTRLHEVTNPTTEEKDNGVNKDDPYDFAAAFQKSVQEGLRPLQEGLHQFDDAVADFEESWNHVVDDAVLAFDDMVHQLDDSLHHTVEDIVHKWDDSVHMVTDKVNVTVFDLLHQFQPSPVARLPEVVADAAVSGVLHGHITTGEHKAAVESPMVVLQYTPPAVEAQAREIKPAPETSSAPPRPPRRDDDKDRKKDPVAAAPSKPADAVSVKESESRFRADEPLSRPTSEPSTSEGVEPVFLNSGATTEVKTVDAPAPVVTVDKVVAKAPEVLDTELALAPSDTLRIDETLVESSSPITVTQVAKELKPVESSTPVVTKVEDAMAAAAPATASVAATTFPSLDTLASTPAVPAVSMDEIAVKTSEAVKVEAAVPAVTMDDVVVKTTEAVAKVEAAVPAVSMDDVVVKTTEAVKAVVEKVEAAVPAVSMDDVVVKTTEAVKAVVVEAAVPAVSMDDVVVKTTEAVEKVEAAVPAVTMDDVVVKTNEAVKAVVEKVEAAVPAVSIDDVVVKTTEVAKEVQAKVEETVVAVAATTAAVAAAAPSTPEPAVAAAPAPAPAPSRSISPKNVLRPVRASSPAFQTREVPQSREVPPPKKMEVTSRKKVEDIIAESKMAAVEEWHKTKTEEKVLTFEQQVLAAEERLLDQICDQEPDDVVGGYVDLLQKVGDNNRVWESHLHDGRWDLVYTSDPQAKLYAIPKFMANFVSGFRQDVSVQRKTVIYSTMFRILSWLPSIKREQRATVTPTGNRKSAQILERTSYVLGNTFRFGRRKVKQATSQGKAGVENRLNENCTYLGRYVKICNLSTSSEQEPVLAVFKRATNEEAPARVQDFSFAALRGFLTRLLRKATGLFVPDFKRKETSAAATYRPA